MQVIRLSFYLPPLSEQEVMQRFLTLATVLTDIVANYKLTPGGWVGGCSGHWDAAVITLATILTNIVANYQLTPGGWVGGWVFRALGCCSDSPWPPFSPILSPTSSSHRVGGQRL